MKIKQEYICTCGYEELFYSFSHRLHIALKPAVKMWQKEIKDPDLYPDTVGLVKWLVRKAKEATK